MSTNQAADGEEWPDTLINEPTLSGEPIGEQCGTGWKEV